MRECLINSSPGRNWVGADAAAGVGGGVVGFAGAPSGFGVATAGALRADGVGAGGGGEGAFGG